MKGTIIKQLSITGTRPKLYAENVNQDASFSLQSEEFACLAVADGAGSHRHADIGARAICEDVCQYLMEHAEEIYASEIEVIRAKITEVISNCLNNLVSQYGGTVRDYGSTLMFALVKADSEDVVTGNLGDGVVFYEFTYDNHRYANVLCFPRGEGNATYLTNMWNVGAYLNIYKDSRPTDEDDRCKRIWLMTDGVYYEVFGPGYQYTRPTFCETVESISARNPEDDATYAYIQWE